MNNLGICSDITYWSDISGRRFLYDMQDCGRRLQWG